MVSNKATLNLLELCAYWLLFMLQICKGGDWKKVGQTNGWITGT